MLGTLEGQGLGGGWPDSGSLACCFECVGGRFALERTRSGIECARLSLSLSNVLEEGEARWMLEYGEVLKGALEVKSVPTLEEVAAD